MRERRRGQEETVSGERDKSSILASLLKPGNTAVAGAGIFASHYVNANLRNHLYLLVITDMPLVLCGGTK